jgi:GntR family transcriptional regulator
LKTAKHISDRIRLMIVTKQFQVGEVLPSTRVLGKQLNTSFHTVRKAYQLLAREGLLKSEKGRGFIVNRQNTILDKTERLEKGAEKFRQLLEELIGYGLDEDEVDALFQEQLSYMDWPSRLNTCACVGRSKELATMLSYAIKAQIGVKSGIITTDEISQSVNFDALFVPLQHFRLFRTESESAVLLPIQYFLGPDLIFGISERSAIESIGLVTRDEESIPVLLDELKLNLRFQGSILAGSIYGRSMPLFVHDVDLVIYTRPCALIVEKMLPEKKRAILEFEVSAKSVDIIRSELWDQY